MNRVPMIFEHCAPMRRMLLTLLLCMASVSAWSQKPADITEGEMALLPPYCPDTQLFKYGDRYTNPSPNAPAWIARMGETFWGMHHYCWGLIRMNRAKQFGVPAPIREGQIRGALADYEYVLANEQPGFPLAPEILTRMGEAFLALNDPGSAMEAFAKARKIKPDYWPPYVAWADVLAGIGKRADAIALVEQVVKLVPNDPDLQRHYKRLSDTSRPAASASRPGATKARLSRAKVKPVPASAPR